MRPSTILAIAFVVVIAILLSPLLIFAMETSRNPLILGLQVRGEPINETHVLLRVEASYAGSIPITGMELELMGRILSIGDLCTGDTKSITAIVSVEDPSKLQQKTFTFKFRVAGLYGVEVRSS